MCAVSAVAAPLSGEKKEVEARCDQIRQSIEQTTSDYDREKLQERLAKLSGELFSPVVAKSSYQRSQLCVDILKQPRNVCRTCRTDTHELELALNWKCSAQLCCCK